MNIIVKIMAYVLKNIVSTDLEQYVVFIFLHVPYIASYGNGLKLKYHHYSTVNQNESILISKCHILCYGLYRD